MSKIRDEKEKKVLEECTFKPNINHKQSYTQREDPYEPIWPQSNSNNLYSKNPNSKTT